MSQPYVFISYASADRERVQEIVAALRHAGITCWLDQHDIAGGTNWGGSIADAIEGCIAFVLLASAASLASRNVRQEIALAWRHDTPYLPLLLDTTPVPNDIAYWLATAQWIEILDHPVETWLPKVTNALAHLTTWDAAPSTPVADVSAETAPIPSLPSPPSSFVGREWEVAEIAALLHTERIVTLVGPGGIGKTRVAIAVGHRLTDTYRDGVVFVDLAPLRDPSLVLPSIAATLGVRDSGEASLLDALVMAIRLRHLLLILDNLEQVIEAAGDISRLVSVCPSLAILATSREPLRIGGETEYPLAPLPLPSVEGHVAIDRLRANPTVALFVQRARAGKPGFDVTTENAQPIVAICQRLDGLPLAIELAAAQIRILSPRALEERLLQPMGVLTGGARDLPQRQRTMRDAIRWSYDLLSPDDQRLFQCLSVFVGGWTFEDADAVVGAADDLGIDLFDGLTSLADKSLITQQEQSDGTTRFSMLGMIREFAAQQLDQSDDGDHVRERLAATIERLSSGLRRALATPEESAAIARLDIDRDNLRAVLDWYLHQGGTSDTLATTGLGIATDCWSYWDTTGRLAEGLRWVEAFLDFEERLPVAVRIDGLSFAGILAINLGAYAVADRHLAAAVTLAQRIQRPELGALAMNMQARRLVQVGRLDDAAALATVSLTHLRVADDGFGIGMTMGTLVQVALKRGDLREAHALELDLIATLRQRGDLLLLTGALAWCARLSYWTGDLAEAATLATEAMTLGREQQYRVMGSWGTMLLSRIEADAGDLHHARQLAIEGLSLLRQSGYISIIIASLVDAAIVADAMGLHTLVLQVCAVTDAQPTISEHTGNWGDVDDLQRLRSRARSMLDDATIRGVEEAARTMTLDDALGEVIAAFALHSSG